MKKTERRSLREVYGAASASALTLLFGIVVLAFLTLVDHSSWFHIRPASGTAAAMAIASEPPPASPFKPAFRP